MFQKSKYFVELVDDLKFRSVPHTHDNVTVIDNFWACNKCHQHTGNSGTWKNIFRKQIDRQRLKPTN